MCFNTIIVFVLLSSCSRGRGRETAGRGLVFVAVYIVECSNTASAVCNLHGSWIVLEVVPGIFVLQTTESRMLVVERKGKGGEAEEGRHGHISEGTTGLI